eukprot:4871364-Amphidinium_carterae.1
MNNGLLQDQLDSLSVPGPTSPPPVSKVKPVSCTSGSSTSSTPSRPSGLCGSPPQYASEHNLSGLSQDELDAYTTLANGLAAQQHQQQQDAQVSSVGIPSAQYEEELHQWSSEPSSPQAAQLRNKRRAQGQAAAAAASAAELALDVPPSQHAVVTAPLGAGMQLGPPSQSMARQAPFPLDSSFGSQDEPVSPQAEALRARKLAVAHQRTLSGMPLQQDACGAAYARYQYDNPSYSTAYVSRGLDHEPQDGGISQEELDRLSQSMSQSPAGVGRGNEPNSPQARHHVRIKRAGAAKPSSKGAAWDAALGSGYP